MEILTHYILPNVVLFGGIYVFAKVVEAAVWYGIIQLIRDKNNEVA